MKGISHIEFQIAFFINPAKKEKEEHHPFFKCGLHIVTFLQLVHTGLKERNKRVTS
jgi:hypothetical protein